MCGLLLFAVPPFVRRRRSLSNVGNFVAAGGGSRGCSVALFAGGGGDFLGATHTPHLRFYFLKILPFFGVRGGVFQCRFSYRNAPLLPSPRRGVGGPGRRHGPMLSSDPLPALHQFATTCAARANSRAGPNKPFSSRPVETRFRPGGCRACPRLCPKTAAPVREAGLLHPAFRRGPLNRTEGSRHEFEIRLQGRALPAGRRR